MRRGSPSLAVVAVAGTLLAGCGSDKPSTDAATKTIEVRLTDAGCEPASLTVAAGPTTFHVTNDGAAGVTEYEILTGTKIVGEVENVAPGLDRSFSLTLSPGSYVTYCPGGKTERGTLVVTGAATG